VVLDTNVVTAGLRSNQGASFVLLRLVSERRLTPLVATSLFLEYEEVLMRPAQLQASGLSAAAAARFLSALAALAEPVDVHFSWRPALPDASDELVLEAAVNGRADALVTHNVRDFVPAVAQFSVPVLTPGQYLREIAT
jgi:putative PIN family toxin of toxin-antitoxin system